MVNIVNTEPRTKLRKITLYRERIMSDIDVLSYKYGEAAIAEEGLRDSIQSDSDDMLDNAVLSQFVEARELILRKKLAFCLEDEEVEEADNNVPDTEDMVFQFILPKSFKDVNLRVGAKMMHDYIVKGALMDWYANAGTNAASYLAGEVVEIESRVIDVFRIPGFIKNPGILYVPSRKIR